MWESLREFSVERHELPIILRNISILLENLTLNVDPRNKKSISIFSYIWLVVMSACYYYIYLVSMVWFVFVRCKETGDLTAAIVVFSLGITNQICLIKLMCLFANRHSLRKLFEDFLICDAQIVPNSRFSYNMSKILRDLKKNVMIFWVSFMCLGVSYVLKPLLMPGRQHMEEIFEFYGFENMEQMKTSPYYEIIFTIQSIAVFGACYTGATISSLFIILAGFIEAQMLALSYEMANIWQDASNSNNNILTEKKYFDQLEKSHDLMFSVKYYESEGDEVNSFECSEEDEMRSENNVENIFVQESANVNVQDLPYLYVKKNLEYIAKFHSANIELVHQIEGIFQLAISLEFVIICTGMIACLLGSLDKTFIVLPFSLMLVSVDCLPGQRIIEASTVFQNAVYDSKWENFDVANRKMILLMLKNSQKVMQLSIGGVVTLSREFLMNVLKATFTAFTTIKSTMN